RGARTATATSGGRSRGPADPGLRTEGAVRTTACSYRSYGAVQRGGGTPDGTEAAAGRGRPATPLADNGGPGRIDPTHRECPATLDGADPHECRSQVSHPCGDRRGRCP